MKRLKDYKRLYFVSYLELTCPNAQRNVAYSISMYLLPKRPLLVV